MFIINNKVNKNRNLINKFIEENKLNLTKEQKAELLDNMLLPQKVECFFIKDEEQLERLLYEINVIPDNIRKYFELSGTYKCYFTYAPCYIQTISAIPKKYMNNTIIEDKVDILLGNEFKKGLIFEENKVSPIIKKDKVCVFLRYEKIYNFGKCPIIMNPQLYFYNCK